MTPKWWTDRMIVRQLQFARTFFSPILLCTASVYYYHWCRMRWSFFLVPSLIFIVVDFALVQLHCQPNAKHLPSETCGCASAVVTGVFVVIFNVLDNLLAAVVAHYNSPHFRTLHIHAHTHTCTFIRSIFKLIFDDCIQYKSTENQLRKNGRKSYCAIFKYEWNDWNTFNVLCQCPKWLHDQSLPDFSILITLFIPF